MHGEGSRGILAFELCINDDNVCAAMLLKSKGEGETGRASADDENLCSLRQRHGEE